MTEDRAPRPCPVTGHPFIRVYPYALPQELCDALLARFDQQPALHRAGQVADQVTKKHIKRCLEVPFTTKWPDLDKQFHAALTATVHRYAGDVPTFKIILDDVKLDDTHYVIQVYDQSAQPTVEAGADGYAWHCDSLLPTTVGRNLAVIAYLNTVEVGGETEFRAWPVSVKPKAGSILLFPPHFDYEHCGRPAVSSRKAIVTTFIANISLPCG